MKTLDDLILDAVTPVVKPCVPHLYTGEAIEYCTFNYTVIADALGDNRANAMRALVQVHYLAPLKANTAATRRALWQALAAVEDFTAPDITNATDPTGQHYVYEFEAVGCWMGGGSDG